MDRRGLVRLAAEVLPPRATIAVYPDHPLLLHPPEILGSHRGALYAVFVVQGTETLGRGRHTFGRYLLSRLALPSNAVFVAAVENPADVDAVPRDLFDIVLPVTQHRPGTLADEPTGAAWQQAVESLRPAHVERFGATWSLDRSPRDERVRRHSGRTTASLSMAGRRSIRGRTPYVSFTSEGHLTLDAPAQRSRQQHMALASAAVLMAVEADYGLIPTAEASTFVLEESPVGRGALRTRRSQEHEKPPTGLVTQYGQWLSMGDAVLALHRAFLPIARTSLAFDIEKPLRAAAFAGYVPESRTFEMGGAGRELQEED